MTLSICCMCGISAIYRSYMEVKLLTADDRLRISRLLTNEIDVYFEDSYRICAICLEKVNNTFQTVQQMRRKCLFTLTLLKSYYENSVDSKWSVFKKSQEAEKLVTDENTTKILEKVESTLINDKCKQCQKAKKEPENNVLKTENLASSSEDYFTDIEWLSDSEDLPSIEEIVSPTNKISNSQIEKTKDVIIEPAAELSTNAINSNHHVPSIRVNKRGYIYATSSLEYISRNEKGLFACLLCQSTFKYQYKAEVHARLKHTKERPFECLECFKSFASSQDLRRHTLNCHENKKFICSKCERSFSRRYELMSHEKTHTNLPNLPCPISGCFKKFYDKFALRRHFTNSHAEKKFKCDQCEKGFRRNYALVYHKKLHHT